MHITGIHTCFRSRGDWDEYWCLCLRTGPDLTPSNLTVGTRASGSVTLNAASRVFPDVDLRSRLLAPHVLFAEVSYTIQQPSGSGDKLVMAPHGWSSPEPGTVRVESSEALPAGTTLRVSVSQTV